jgi:hypothetical protein
MEIDRNPLLVLDMMIEEDSSNSENGIMMTIKFDKTPDATKLMKEIEEVVRKSKGSLMYYELRAKKVIRAGGEDLIELDKNELL